MSIVRQALEFYLAHLKQQLFHANAGLDAKGASELETKIEEIEMLLRI